MSNPVFSIIIPAYNVEDYVGSCLESCVNQIGVTHEEYEIIVVNDGSTDNTQSEIEKFGQVDNISILNQDNRGLSAARNKGVELARGEYILFLDSDDWFADNALLQLKQNLGDADLIMFPMIYYYGDQDVMYNSVGTLVSSDYSAEEILNETIGISEFQVCPAPCKCYKTKLFKEDSLKFIEGILHEDGPFFFDTMSKVNKIRYVNAFFYYYRQKRKNSITTVGRRYRNAEGVFIGNEHVFNVYGYSNKNVCYYYISTMTMQLFQHYKTREDAAKVVSYLSKRKSKLFLLKSLFKSRFLLRPAFLSLLVIFCPRTSRLIYTLKNGE